MLHLALARPLIVTMLATMCLLAADDFLEDLTLIVSANGSPAGGLKALPGMAIVSLQAADDQDKLGGVNFKAKDKEDLYKFKDRLEPCANNSEVARKWRYNVAPSRTNANVECDFSGTLQRCEGQGGAPPSFSAKVVHVDLDVDSDNDSDPISAQKEPSGSDDEDTAEYPTGSAAADKPGLILIKNRGFDEGGQYATQDFAKDGAIESDLDLVKATVQCKGRSGDAAFTIPDAIRLYKKDGDALTRITSGQRVSLQPGVTMNLWLEGISVAVVELKVDFYVESGAQPASDMVKITVVDIPLELDRDRSGTITDGDDSLDWTWTDRRHRFWLNNDRDSMDGGGADLEPTTADFARTAGFASTTTGRILNRRDLEDYDRMCAIVRGVDGLFDAKKVSSSVRWMPFPTGSPSLRLHRGSYLDGRLLPYENEGEGAAAATNGVTYGLEVQSDVRAFLPHAAFQTALSGRAVPLFWQANQAAAQRPGPPPAPATGALGHVLLWGGADGRPVAVFRHLYLKLSDPRRWYQHVSAGDVVSDEFVPAPAALTSPTDGQYRYSSEEPSLWAQSTDSFNERVKYGDSGIMFIHGYRMQPWERRAFAESLWKRLYWQGYGGRFLLISWPTEWVGGTAGQLTNARNYDRSEYQARMTGLTVLGPEFAQLYTKLEGLSIEKTIYIAHSMGNVVYASAARASDGAAAGGNYIALMSADAASAYKIQVGPPTPSASAPWYGSGNFGQAFTPDVYAFDAPRQPRSVTIPFRRTVQNAPEQLLAVVDGQPYARGIVGSSGRRIAGINDVDFATSVAWYLNQRAKVDGDRGWTYERESLPPTQANPRTFRDRWLVRDGGPFAGSRPPGLATTPYSGGWFQFEWDFVDWFGGDANQAAILSFLTAARSRSVGALDISRTSDNLTSPSVAYRPGPVAPAGQIITTGPVQEGLFTGSRNLRGLGVSNGDYDHSYPFNHTCQKTAPVYRWLFGVLATGN